MVRCVIKVVDKNTGRLRRCKNESDGKKCWVHKRSQVGGARRRPSTKQSKSKIRTSDDIIKQRKEADKRIDQALDKQIRDNKKKEMKQRRARSKIYENYGRWMKGWDTEKLLKNYSKTKKKIQQGDKTLETLYMLEFLEREIRNRPNEMSKL
tara:strand:- start:518 stop:973 length:456 start_codon:yes stop_codon:yes gene_type:complete